jgi:hypothetical protein
MEAGSYSSLACVLAQKEGAFAQKGVLAHKDALAQKGALAQKRTRAQTYGRCGCLAASSLAASSPWTRYIDRAASGSDSHSSSSVL